MSTSRLAYRSETGIRRVRPDRASAERMAAVHAAARKAVTKLNARRRCERGHFVGRTGVCSRCP